MAKRQLLLDCSGLVLLYIFLGTLWESGAGQIRYLVPEEMLLSKSFLFQRILSWFLELMQHRRAIQGFL